MLAILAGIFILMTPSEARKLHLWQAFGALIGFTLGWYWLTKQQRQQAISFNVFQRLLLVSIALLGSIAYFYGLRTFPMTQQSLIFCQFFFIAIWINLSKILLQRMFKKSDSQ